MCEEFHVEPHRAYWMWLTYPCGVLEEIMELRSYASAKQMYDGTDDPAHLPASVVEMVQPIDFAVAKEKLDAAKAKQG